MIQAGYDGGYNGAWFEFRQDGTYKFGDQELALIILEENMNLKIR